MLTKAERNIFEMYLAGKTAKESFVCPAGCDVLLNAVFWEIDKHSTDGTLEKIVENWNSDFKATKANSVVKWVHANGERKTVANATDGSTPVWYSDAKGNTVDNENGEYTKVKYTVAEKITDCVDPDGSFIDMNLYINIVYPTNPAGEVPVMSLANSSGNPRTSVGTDSAYLRPHSNHFLYEGYANVVFDYLWMPMARNASFGYYDGSSGNTKDHMNYAVMMYNDKLVNTAAMRYLRYISLSDTETYNFDLDDFGVYGNSKGGWFTFLGEKVLTEQEWNTLLEIADDMIAKKTLPCTNCRYCTPYCAQELNIPQMIKFYNAQMYPEHAGEVKAQVRALPDEQKPTACIACRACEDVCPQNIKISEMMAELAKRTC